MDGQVLKHFLHTHFRTDGICIRFVPHKGASQVGVFATRDLPIGFEIGDYTGNVIDSNEMQRRYGHDGKAGYLFQLGEDSDEYVDPMRDGKVVTFSPVMYVNEPGPSEYCNARFFVYSKKRRITLRTFRKVSKGTEILASYGPHYHGRPYLINDLDCCLYPPTEVTAPSTRYMYEEYCIPFVVNIGLKPNMGDEAILEKRSTRKSLRSGRTKSKDRDSKSPSKVPSVESGSSSSALNSELADASIEASRGALVANGRMTVPVAGLRTAMPGNMNESDRCLRMRAAANAAILKRSVVNDTRWRHLPIGTCEFGHAFLIRQFQWKPVVVQGKRGGLDARIRILDGDTHDFARQLRLNPRSDSTAGTEGEREKAVGTAQSGAGGSESGGNNRSRVDPKELFCPLCEMSRVAEDRGGSCATQYWDGRSSVQWKCRSGHAFRARPYEVAGGSWCALCQAIEVAGRMSLEVSPVCDGDDGDNNNASDGSDVSDESDGSRVRRKRKRADAESTELSVGDIRSCKFRWKCACGHRWVDTLMNIKRSRFQCLGCGYNGSNVPQSQSRPLSTDQSSSAKGIARKGTQPQPVSQSQPQAHVDSASKATSQPKEDSDVSDSDIEVISVTDDDDDDDDDDCGSHAKRSLRSDNSHRSLSTTSSSSEELPMRSRSPERQREKESVPKKSPVTGLVRGELFKRLTQHSRPSPRRSPLSRRRVNDTLAGKTRFKRPVGSAKKIRAGLAEAVNGKHTPVNVTGQSSGSGETLDLRHSAVPSKSAVANATGSGDNSQWSVKSALPLAQRLLEVVRSVRKQ